MNKKFLGLAGILILTLACGISAPASPAQPGVETIVAATFQALTANAPTSAPQPSGIQVSFQNVSNISFVIPDGLASGASSEVVAKVEETSDMPWWEVAPEYTRYTFTSYNNTLGKFGQADIRVYPAQEYKNAEESIKRLQAILASPTAPLTKDTMPSLPVNAAQMFAAQMQRIDFVNGSGVRMITQYGQAVGPAANDGVFYHFQGLTNDGKYYIIAVLPTGAPFLAYDMNATPPQPADGIPFSYDGMDASTYEAYFKAVEDKINATDGNTFQPSLEALDALIQSITVTAP